MNQQRKLFDTEPDPWVLDDQGGAEQRVATVVFPSGPAQEFDYLVPDALRQTVEPGRRVRVPLGRSDRLVIGYCVRVETQPPGRRRLKPLHDVVDSRSLLSPLMLRLTRWIADHYLCPWPQVLEAVVPAGVRIQAGTRAVPLLSLAAGAQEKAAAERLAPKQRAVIKVLADAPEPLTSNEVARRAGCTEAPIKALRLKGLIRVEQGRISRKREALPAAKRERDLVLNADQRAALAAIAEAIDAGRHQTVLIHGVTGSGKTEVYMQAIHRVVQQGRQAIVLVPEISLTPQTVERFRSRFDGVAVLHSHLSDAERHWHWLEIAEGRIQVVVGARSAIFAPTPRLGLIVLDEEHESSFKQETAPRYHARDVPAPGRNSSRCRWCWARPRPRWKAINGRRRASTG
jgi:primosomal protein N' (replication factor Y)